MMGLKSIDMQIAIMRQQDASKIQEQLTRQGQQYQETLTQQQLTEEVLRRQRTNRFEHVEKRNVDTNEERSKREHYESQKDKSGNERSKKQKEKIEHPYLGRHIDWSG